jgi:HNH endonuclease
MSRARDSVKARRICVATHRHDGPLGKGRYMTCHKCQSLIDVVRDDWRADHNIHWANGGEDTPENLFPICLGCDGGVGGKAADDTAQIAKGKRIADKHFGVRKKVGFAGSRKFNGEVVWRNKQ